MQVGLPPPCTPRFETPPPDGRSRESGGTVAANLPQIELDTPEYQMKPPESAASRHDIKVTGDELVVRGERLATHSVASSLGEGANGVVFLGTNKLLNRQEAIKVWFPAKEADRRDKLKQAVGEITKLAAVNGNSAVQIYDARIVQGGAIAMMEYVNGETLKEYMTTHDDPYCRLGLAFQYLDVIQTTTTPSTRHGDPHWKNVLVHKVPALYGEPDRGMKLCDFGTSAFSGAEASAKRHWGIVRETVLRITKNLPDQAHAEARLNEADIEFAPRLADMIERADLRPDQSAAAHTATLRDYLDTWALLKYGGGG